ncbi:enoyl-CoA hydratase/isomerase family protein [Nocardioides sp. KR10-350]|uniref:enoyl-CoA hydratase/isomerase family protein n=1 Tax=Nocardioides cheoyonin TaxID=3156615 RepID=UPI0032B59969
MSAVTDQPGAERTSRLRLEVADRVATVTISCPERRNALDHATMEALPFLFDELDRRDDVWVVMVTGEGDEAFSAGRDLKSAGPDRPVRRMPTVGPIRYPFEAVRECSKPVIAAINGWALGGGFELALACDLRIAAERARLGMPESKLGLGGQFAAVMLPRLVPAAVANEFLFFGESLTAHEAQAHGLVARVFPDATFRAEAATYAARLASRAPLSVRRFKAIAALSHDLSVEACLRADPYPNPYLSTDAEEGVAAWRAKRPPVWRAE